jgi:mannose-6-phosphate isomerase-like protein (cupin superfamily)
MTHIRLSELAQQLPHAGSSSLISTFGDARLKVVRMDATAYPEECHDYAEGLLVLDGQMMLELNEQAVRVGAGEIYVVPAGVVHRVGTGSMGTLLILDV